MIQKILKALENLNWKFMYTTTVINNGKIRLSSPITIISLIQDFN